MRLPLCPLALVLFALPLAARAEGTTVPAPELYKRAVAHLNEGRWFESAIADLSDAVRQDPGNSEYHLALGCAQVDRAGSVAYAAFVTDQLLNAQTQYAKDLAAWQLAQTDPKSDDYGKPAPTPPPSGMHFQTKDDLRYLRLTGKQSVARVTELGRAAQGEWYQAVRLAKTPQARAQAECVGGWGLLYERKLLEYTGYADRKIPGAPKPLDPVAAFQAATKDDPTQAAYWEALGYAYPDSGSNNPAHAPEIIRAWRKALALDSRSTALRLRLYSAQFSSDPKAALETLKTVAETDPGNSFLQYGLAALLFKQIHYSDVHDRVDPTITDFSQPRTPEQFDAWRNKVVDDLAAKDDASSEKIASEAVSAIESGNAGDHWAIPDYTPPVPKLLWHAWDYWTSTERLFNANLAFSARLRELARAAGGYSLVAAHRGDAENGARAARACVGMGMKLVGDWPIRDETPNDGTILRALVGLAIAAIGYQDLRRMYEQTGNDVLAQETKAEDEALRKKKTAYADAITKAEAEDTAADQAYWFNNY